jgi:hypothetical protein
MQGVLLGSGSEALGEYSEVRLIAIVITYISVDSWREKLGMFLKCS